jgi:hypothetical protein
VVLPLPLRLVVRVLVAPPPLRRLLRRRLRVSFALPGSRAAAMLWSLTTRAEKEESDEDMGFGLFD